MFVDFSLDFRRTPGTYWSSGDTYQGGQGNDLLWTTAGNDIFKFDIGDGEDWITDLRHDDAYFSNNLNDLDFYWKGQDVAARQVGHNAQLLTGHDTLQFGSGIKPTDIIVHQIDNSLVFSHSNGEDRVVFANWFRANVNQLNRVEFVDGAVWDAAMIKNLSEKNHAPVIRQAVTNQTIDEDSMFNFILPTKTFMEFDAGDTIDFSATLSDGNVLPAWLNFDNSTQTFGGAAPIDASGDYQIKVMAIDSYGLTTEAGFKLTINDINPPITGNTGDDTLSGTNYTDVINGGAGNDTLIGGLGNDTLIAGSGSDWLQGGEGDDTLVVSEDASWSSRFIAYNAGSPGHRGTGERISITALQRSFDLFDGGQGLDSIQGSDGNDAIFLDDSFSPLPNGRGPRIKKIERFNMGAGDDIVDLTSPTYAYGDVEFNGEAGNDVLWGSSGNDTLNGGQGDDKLTGGAGNDTYLFGKGDGHDQIRNYAADYANSTDTLQFGQGVEADDLWFERAVNDLKITVFNTGDDIIIKNWYRNDSHKLDEIKLNDGQTLMNNQLSQLVQAMAAFNAPSAGTTELTGQIEEEVAPVIAASWE